MNMAKETEIQPGVSVFGGPAKAQEPLPPLLPSLPSQEVTFDAAAIVESIGHLEGALRDMVALYEQSGYASQRDQAELEGLAKGQAETDRRLDKLDELTASLLAGASGVQERLHQLQSQTVQTAANHIDQAQTVSRCCKELAELGKELQVLRYRYNGMEEGLRTQRDKLAKQQQGLEAVYDRLPALRGPQE